MKLSQAAILANIEHYENLVAKSYNEWEKHLQELAYWLDQLEEVEHVVD